jgi:hypothetical protein
LKSGSSTRGLGDRIGIVPMLLIDASFNTLAFALIRVPIQTARLPPEISPVAGQLLEQEAPTL